MLSAYWLGEKTVNFFYLTPTIKPKTLDGISIAEKEAARLKEWQTWITEFTRDHSKAVAIPHAAELLNDYYWRLAFIYLKPLLEYTNEQEHNLHYYKIISASEITVMAVIPFKTADVLDKEERQQLNAEFACFVAFSIIGNWKINGKKYIDEDKLTTTLDSCEIIDNINGEEKFYPQSLMDEHIEWLKDLNTAAALPILSNSQTWRAIFLASRIDV